MSGREKGSAASTFVIALAAFVAGLAMGWLLFGSDTPPDEPRPAAPPAASPQPAAAPRPSRNGDRAEAADADRAVAAALTSPVELPSLAGTGTIRGTVKMDTGEPLSGIELRAYAQTPPEWNAETRGRQWDDIPLEETLRRTIRQRRWSEASRKTASSAADGSFELTGLVDTNWSVTPRADGYEFRKTSQSAWFRPGETCDIVATPSVRVEVDVRLPDGSRPRNANLTWSGAVANNTLHQGWAPGSETISRRPGRWTLAASAGEDQRYTAAPLDVDVRAGMAPVVVTMKARPGVVISAKRPDGFTGLRVRFFVRRAEGAEPSDDDLRGANAADREMSFEFPDDERAERRAFLDLAPGAWIAAAGFDGAPLARRTVEVADGVVDCELAPPAPDLAQFVEVHAAGPDGAPLVAATFEWQYRAETERASYNASTVARGRGVWLVRRVGPGDRPHSSQWSGKRDKSGTWYLTVRVDGLGQEETAVAAGAARTDVRFVTPATATIRVTGAPSGAAKRLDVSLIRQGGEFIDVTGGDGGTMRSRPSKPGPYELRLTLKIGEWSNLVVAKRAVDLASGENALEIAVPPLYPLDLDLGADESGTCFLHHVTDDDDTEFVNVELDADGRAKFDLVPAGRYRVQAGGKDHEFRVPETRTFKLP